jgi:hypothetical protein
MQTTRFRKSLLISRFFFLIPIAEQVSFAATATTMLSQSTAV